MWWVPLATAALSYFGNKKSRKDAARAQVGQTREEAAAGVIGRVEGAKAAGLHPLAGLGTTVSGAVMPVGNSWDSIADGIGQAAMTYRDMKIRKEEREAQQEQENYNRGRAAYLDKLSGEAAAREVENAALRNKLLATQIKAQEKAMADSDRDFAASQAQLARMTPSVPLRQPEPLPHQYRQMIDRFGKPVSVPNWDIYDLELPESVGAATLALPEVRNSQSWYNRAWNEIKRYFNSSGKEYFADPRNPQGLPAPVEY